MRLFRSEGVGPRTFKALINQFGSAQGALAALPSLKARSGVAISVCSVADAEKEMAGAARSGVRFVAMGEEGYSYALAQIADAPPLIGVRGDLKALARPGVAIVGSRNASAVGMRLAEILARGVGEGGFAIISGLARGIDARAHEASLRTGAIAVLAGGHHRVYPAEHEPLLQRILDAGGAVVSEMPIDWTPRARDFPRRNRIVSGLALGIVVIEAARKSGSLITARFALEQGREVFATPGSPLDPRAEGANDLIRQGATLVTEPDHVLSVLAPLVARPPEADSLAETGSSKADANLYWDELDLPDLAEPEAAQRPSFPGWEDAPEPAFQAPEQRIMNLLSFNPIEIDELVRLSGVNVRDVKAVLVELAMSGRIERHGANRIALCPSG